MLSPYCEGGDSQHSRSPGKAVYCHIITRMKRSNILYGILIVLAAGVVLVSFIFPQETLDSYELYFLWIVMPVLGWMWFQAYIDYTKGN